jgi:shikimate kinase
VAAYKKCVVATGGGVVKKKANWMHLRNGVVLCLSGTPSLLAGRIMRDGAGTRPLFKGVEDDAGAVAGKIEEMMKERAPMYANADVQVRLAENEDTPGTEGETLEELNVRIMRCVKARIEDDGTKDRLRSEPKPGDITITGA